jgi:D-sedoheptulose 7-phosphate isomerase
VLGLGQPGDVFLGISTSGNSPNVLRALDAARGRGLVTLGFSGASGGGMRANTDLLLAAPSDRTAIIQQIHIIAAHVICALVERALCPPPDAG